MSKENSNRLHHTRKTRKTKYNFLSRVVIQFFGSFTLGAISAYLVYETPKPNPGNFMGAAGMIIFSGIVFLIVFVISYLFIWLYLRKKT
jgi:hypothetical protein